MIPKPVKTAVTVRPSRLIFLGRLAGSLLVLATQPLSAQVESVEAPRPPPVWVSHGRVEGHLALRYSPAGAFSPDSSALAVVNEDKVVLMDLAGASVRKILRPRLENLADLEIQSANFLAPGRLFLLGTALMQVKGKGPGRPTGLLAFQWDIERDVFSGKVNIVGASGGYGPARYFPAIGYLSLYKESKFDLWNPANGRGGQIPIPDLTRQPNIFEFSPDGHWLLLAQVETSSTADPAVIRLSEHRFVDSLRGHQGTVLNIAFSRDSRRVVTACEDGKVRIYSVGDWKLVQTLDGHQGPVHWAEFSPDGSLVASAGEDKTVRVWSAETGQLLQMLEESQEPLLTVAFSPSGGYVAASAEQVVLVWRRTGAD